MTNQNLEENLADLFQKTGAAHHQAFIETDGVDPEWPLWYADYLLAPLTKLLGAEMTRSELVYLIVTADKERNTLAPGADWKRYYAGFFFDRYA